MSAARRIQIALLLSAPLAYGEFHLLGSFADPTWAPDGGEAAGGIFMLFALAGLFTATLAMPFVYQRLSGRTPATFIIVLCSTCVASSVLSVAAFRIYPYAIGISLNNYDTSLSIPIALTSSFLQFPIVVSWWWLAVRAAPKIDA
jgi:hypothetical protein